MEIIKTKPYLKAVKRLAITQQNENGFLMSFYKTQSAGLLLSVVVVFAKYALPLVIKEKAAGLE